MINQRIEKADQLISAGRKYGSYKSWLASIKEQAAPVASQLYRSHYVRDHDYYLHAETDKLPDLHVSTSVLLGEAIPFSDEVSSWSMS